MASSINRKVERKAAQLKWWQIALISIAVSALGALSGGNPSQKHEKKVYRNRKQAPWAPPAWAFGPAWTLNNFFLLLGLRKLLSNHSISDKRKYLLLQACIWFIFFSFNNVYFKKKSPILAAIWTNADVVLALAGFIMTRKEDKKAALSYLPLLVWTSFASTVGDYQALKNPDPFLKTKALMG
ncbi:MAG TPA: TspO/MBR family protein [Flavipsychrobacter sp.]|nr:TspO/MBR family protein [Flavipsychrobacter sp.]